MKKMKKILKNEIGITLIALVITVIILLILAGISIVGLTNSGLFAKTQQAKQEQENAQIQENTTLNEYEQWIANYIGGGITSTPQEPEQPTVTLASKVNVGDYVQYIPDTVTTEAHNALITELGTYSGNTDNTTTTTKQDTLNWRVLDIVKDESGKDCVRLISATPTTSTVKLYNYNGYNNAVYLLDKTCNTLYNKVGYTKNVQNLKIEDIEKYMVSKPALSTTTVSPKNKKYPSLLMQELGQTVNETTGNLSFSEQITPLNQTGEETASSWSLKTTFWEQTITVDSFINEKYYNLIIKDGASNYSTYWISSRCINANSNNASFHVRSVNLGNVKADCLYHTINETYEYAYTLRPVMTLNASVSIDLEKSGDGTEVENAYILK